MSADIIPYLCYVLISDLVAHMVEMQAKIFEKDMSQMIALLSLPPKMTAMGEGRQNLQVETMRMTELVQALKNRGSGKRLTSQKFCLSPSMVLRAKCLKTFGEAEMGLPTRQERTLKHI